MLTVGKPLSTMSLSELGRVKVVPFRTLDVRANTRTIRASWFGYWFTNGNNYHIEHHWLPAIPNDRFPELHRAIAEEIEIDTYPAFYWRFLNELYRNTFTGGSWKELA